MFRYIPACLVLARDGSAVAALGMGAHRHLVRGFVGWVKFKSAQADIQRLSRVVLRPLQFGQADDGLHRNQLQTLTVNGRPGGVNIGQVGPFTNPTAFS